MPISILVILGWLAAGQAMEAAAQRIGSDALRATNVHLEGRAQAVAASALASSERLRSIIDSAVDGIIVVDHAAISNRSIRQQSASSDTPSPRSRAGTSPSSQAGVTVDR
jgi:hypothetical protein